MGRAEASLPKALSHDSAKALLIAEGWTATVGGKHSTKMTKPGERPITLPRHKGQDYGRQLRSAILRQAGLKGPQSEDDHNDKPEEV
jgi:predicted RNA binding protein YcfA (HicA-like mRNA interferase family)